MTRVSVVICTFNRHGPLQDAVRTARAQALPEGVAAEILVVDNAPDANAGPVVCAMMHEPGLALRYESLPQPNISLARNRGVCATTGDMVVFLDDDEWCEPGWLAALVATAEATGADVVFGAVVPDFPDGPPAWDPTGRPYERRLSQPSGTAMGIQHDSQASGRWIGTGNSLLRRSTCLAGDAPFDPLLGRSGGEDYDLFVRLAAAGRRMVWCSEAVVHELVPGPRASFGYMVRRNWRGGQQWAAISISRARRPALRAVAVFARVSVQLVLVTAQWAWHAARGSPNTRLRWLKVAQVAGKLVWWTVPGDHR